MKHTFPTHAIVLLEPTVHVLLGATLVAWWGGGGEGMLILVAGVAFLTLGICFGIPAVLRFWRGAFTLSPNSIDTHGGLFKTKHASINRADVVSINHKRGARLLRFDPIHQLLSRFSNYGSVEINTQSGQQYVVHPVSLSQAVPTLEAWQADGTSTTPMRRSTWPLPLTLALCTLACGGAAVAQTGDRTALVIVAGALEAAFWGSLAAAYLRRSSAPTISLTQR